MKYIVWLLLCGLLLAACDKDDDDKRFDLQGAIAYAGPYKNINPDSGRFNFNAYMLREYQIAINPTLNEPQTCYQGTFAEWKNESWEFRASYLPPPYRDNINIVNMQQYYEMIGRNPLQFGYGWTDTYDPAVNYFWGSEGDIWSQQSGDNPATIGFDGQSHFQEEYLGVIGE